MPEGWAHMFAPDRVPDAAFESAEPGCSKRPEGTGRFYHYMTEHGVLPAGMRHQGRARGWQLKSLCLTRSLCLWLNKGVDVMHYFVAHDRDAAGFGLLPTDVAEAARRTCRSSRPPRLRSRALRNLTPAVGRQRAAGCSRGR